MRNRGLKNRKAISTSIDEELYKELQKLSEETDIPISKLFDKALKLLIANPIKINPPKICRYFAGNFLNKYPPQNPKREFFNIEFSINFV